MDAKAANGGAKNSLSKPLMKREEDKYSNFGSACVGDDVKDLDDLEKKLEEVNRLRKYLDTFEYMLTAMKELNNDIPLSESGDNDSLGIVNRLTVLLCDTEKGAMSDLESSALYRKHCELIEKCSQMDCIVGRVQSVLSRKEVRNLTYLLEDCQKNMLGFRISLKEFQYIRAMQKEIGYLIIRYEMMLQLNNSLTLQNDKLMDIIESRIHNKYKYERKRRYSV